MEDSSRPALDRLMEQAREKAPDPGLTPLNRAQLLTEDDYLAKLEQHGDDFQAAMGAEGIRELLKGLDVMHEIEKLRKELETTPDALRTFLATRRLRLDLSALHPFARWITPTECAAPRPAQSCLASRRPADCARRCSCSDTPASPRAFCIMSLRVTSL